MAVMYFLVCLYADETRTVQLEVFQARELVGRPDLSREQCDFEFNLYPKSANVTARPFRV